MLQISTRRLGRAALALAFVVGFSGDVVATESRASEVPLLRDLIGTWKGSGTLFGREAEFRMEWSWVLDGQFLHLAFENRVKGAEGNDRVLLAWALYTASDSDSLGGTWFDSRGVTLPLNAAIEDRTLTTEWGTPETEQGQTVYQLQDDGTVTVEDSVLKDGEWKGFGRSTYTRVQSP